MMMNSSPRQEEQPGSGNNDDDDHHHDHDHDDDHDDDYDDHDDGHFFPKGPLTCYPNTNTQIPKYTNTMHYQCVIWDLYKESAEIFLFTLNLLDIKYDQDCDFVYLGFLFLHL